MRRIVRPLAVLLGLILVLALVAALALWLAIAASRPVLDGEAPLAGLARPATIERDALGVATIRAESRLDAYRALGFVHAQERYFEMDLARRQAAGELAELLGPALLDADLRVRPHRLRARAAASVERMAPAQRELLAAYVAGVNAGIAALGARPWAYLPLRQRPAPWSEVDSVLVVHSMYLILTNAANTRELRFDAIRRHAPPALAALFDPGLGQSPLDFAGSEWDAPLDGGALPVPRLPRADEVDLRALDPALFGRRHAISGDLVAGSNAFAVAGSRSATGTALVANDMHLGLAVPSLWFRARLEFPDPDAPDGRIAVTGVSLPGVPGIIVGSNGHVAWGFTNSYVDAGDWVVVRYADADRTRYCLASAELIEDGETRRHCTESAPVTAYRESIRVAGGETREIVVRETRWGPILATDADGHDLASLWLGHRPEAIDLGLAELERVRTVEDAIAKVQRIGMPPQNLVVGDARGAIGWTVTGRLPRRQGYFPRIPADFSVAPNVGWVGWLDPAEYPVRIAPSGGAIWTANARLVGGAELARLGDGGYALGARAMQIRDGLAARDRFDERAMLGVALDDRALFLARWRERMLAALASHPRRSDHGALETAVRDWGGRAAAGSAGYRAVREWRDAVVESVVDGLTAPIRAAQPDFETPRLEQIEGPVWRILESEPPHLLPPIFEDWNALLHAAIDRVAARLDAGDGRLATWGDRNRARIQHPLARAVPALSRWLDMPRDPLDGDAFMPRVQAPRFGASQRMVVSPGREAEGLFHMPGGQSGHPLSPFYGAGHEDWVAGRPTPFLPGKTAHSLVLRP
jgi:penicillin amidase